jgi:hypothetical protein
MSFKLIATTDSGASCEVTDPGIRGAVAKWFQELAVSAADSAQESPVKRGPGRPRKSTDAQAGASNAGEEPPPSAP